MIALPAILYGAEVILPTQDTIVTIEKCQNQVAKFMLQIPQSSANISSCIDAGLQPVWSLIPQLIELKYLASLKAVLLFALEFKGYVNCHNICE